MKIKISVLVTVLAVALATGITGYAFYENQSKIVLDNQSDLTKKNEVYVKVLNNKESVQYEQIDLAEDEKLQYENLQKESVQNVNDSNDSIIKEVYNSENYDNSDCCDSGFGSMLDENGNIVDEKSFMEELEAAVENGDLSEEDKEYYIYMYETCAQIFTDSDVDSASNLDSGYTDQDTTYEYNEDYYPSCH